MSSRDVASGFRVDATGYTREQRGYSLVDEASQFTHGKEDQKALYLNVETKES